MLEVALVAMLVVGFLLGWVCCCRYFDMNMSRLTQMQKEASEAQYKAEVLYKRLEEKLDFLERPPGDK